MERYITIKGWRERFRTTVNRAYLFSTAQALLFLAAAMVFNFIAGTYATIHASGRVADIILDNIPRFDVTYIFIYGTLGGLSLLAALLIARFEDIPFAVKTIALFVFIRAIFVTLTHIGPYDGFFSDPSYIMAKLSFGADLFFSGHTGMPFLLSLIYWDTPHLRWTALVTSVTLAILVLLGHLHYSIDVFAAYFITYSIFQIAKKFFASDYRAFKKNEERVNNAVAL